MRCAVCLRESIIRLSNIMLMRSGALLCNLTPLRFALTIHAIPMPYHQYISKCDNNSANTGVYSIIGCFGINECDNTLPCHCTVAHTKAQDSTHIALSCANVLISCACVYSSRVCPRMRDTFSGGACVQTPYTPIWVWGGGLGAGVWLALPPPISIFFINKVNYML